MIEQILNTYGKLGVESIKADVSRYSATGQTAQSVKYVVLKQAETYTLRFLGRKFFKALETGRGPRKGTTYQEFDLNILEYMKIRGIGSDLPEKKRAQLARFIAYKINKEGDSVFKKGGRQVYSDNLLKLVSELKKALAKDLKDQVIKTIRRGFGE